MRAPEECSHPGDLAPELGDLATELGDLDEAGAHFESALSITATQPEAQAALNATKIEIGLAQGAMAFSEWMMTKVPSS